jgi:phosphatidylserine/phosphatidylglycerophosphate/cardiolipin synthase-like enzyme
MRKQTRLATLLIVLAVFTAIDLSEAFDVILHKETPAQLYFSPQGGCTEGILKTIERGVKVALISDKSERTEGLTPTAILANAGIPVYLDGKHAVANNRVIIVDRQVVVTGSFNFNPASEDMNAENLLILDSRELAAEYRKNWLQHRQHSEPY